jgi:hypothetical protein
MSMVLLLFFCTDDANKKKKRRRKELTHVVAEPPHSVAPQKKWLPSQYAAQQGMEVMDGL